MKNLFYLISIYLITTFHIQAQYSLTHEIGVTTGPILFQTDYGETNNSSTSYGSVGFGAGIVHYLSFYNSSHCNCSNSSSFFNKHFKIKSELSYNKTNLRHDNTDNINDNSLTNIQIRSMRGSSTNLNLGMLLEYHFNDLEKYEYKVGSFSPYFSLGAQYVWNKHEASSTLGRLGDQEVTFPKYLNAFSNNSLNLWSIVASVGSRYKISTRQDLFIDLRIQRFNSDWVDGLNPITDLYPENNSPDWLLWMNLGYIYYIY